MVRALLGTKAGDGGALAQRLAPTHNEAAFDTYLQGLHLLRQTASPEAAEQAAVHFGRAVEQDSGFVLAQVGLCRAEILRFQNKHSPDAFDNAKLACGRAAKMDPRLAEVKLALGDLHAAANDHARAFEYYRGSLQQATTPRVPVAAHVGMAQLYAVEGKHDLAAREFGEALKLSPDNALVHANIGYQQYLDGQLEPAVASYRRALVLAPDNPDLWDTLGGIYMAAGNPTEAAATLQHAVTLRPTAANLTDLGLLRFRAGDYTAAVSLQRQAIAVDPQDFMTWGNLGDALRALSGDRADETRHAFTEAASRAEGYLRVKPDDAQAVAALAFYRVMLGDPDHARRLVARAEALPDQSGEVALLDAETLALLGDLDAARQRLAQARARGVREDEINSNLTFRRLGLLPPSGAADKPAGTESPVPGKPTGHSTEGE
ncbi:tetratricopeptide repeat protein [Rhodanobacter lindaniclasticus]